MTEAVELELAGVSHSTSIAEIVSALVAAQADLPAVLKDSVNPHFRSKYASLDAIIGAVREPLAKHGLAVVQGATSLGLQPVLIVETMLVHKSGEWFSNRVTMPVVKIDPQGAGAALTYGRRYGLSALLSLATDEDDDANAAVPKPAATRRRRGSESKPVPAPPNVEAKVARKTDETDATAEQRDRIYKLIARLDVAGMESAETQKALKQIYAVTSIEKLGTVQAADAIRRMEARMVELEAKALVEGEDIPF